MAGRLFIPLYVNVYDNARVIRASQALTGGDVEKMVGHLGRLWGWAIEHAEEGELGHIPDREIARIMNWPVARSPQRHSRALVDALVTSGLLQEDRTDVADGASPLRRIHDWWDYAGLLVEARKRDRKRKQEERERKRRERELREGADRAEADRKERAPKPSAGRPPEPRPAPAPSRPNVSAGRHSDASAGRPPVPERIETRPDRISLPTPSRGTRDATDTTVTGTRAERAWQEAQASEIVARAPEPFATALTALQSELPVSGFITWFGHATFEELVHDDVEGDGHVERVVYVRNEFERGWVTDHYRAKLRAAIELVSGVPGGLRIEVRRAEATTAPPPTVEPGQAGPTP